ncbi:MAG: hypothetical protein ACT4OY_05995 [Alphaproteobacteria bacterium]
MIEVKSLTPDEVRVQAEQTIEAAQRPYYRRPKSEVSIPHKTLFNSLNPFSDKYVLGTQIISGSENVYLAKKDTPFPEGVRIMPFRDIPDSAIYTCYSYNTTKPVKIHHCFTAPEDYEFQ